MTKTGSLRRKSVFLGAVVAAAAASFALASPAQASGGAFPTNIRYDFCVRHSIPNPTLPGYSTRSCWGTYHVDRQNYQFTENAINTCPSMGALMNITVDSVKQPDGTEVLAGYKVTPAR